MPQIGLAEVVVIVQRWSAFRRRQMRPMTHDSGGVESAAEGHPRGAEKRKQPTRSWETPRWNSRQAVTGIGGADGQRLGIESDQGRPHLRYFQARPRRRVAATLDRRTVATR